MKIHVCDVPSRFHAGVVEAEPRLQNDFFLVEHMVHLNLAACENHCADTAKADLYFVPFYPSCLYAAKSYSTGHDIASTSKLARLASDIHVHRSFARVLAIVRSRPEWKRRSGRDHIFVFGQGRGANLGYLWTRFRRDLSRACLLAVEGRPYGNPGAFDPAKDVVIPGYVPWTREISSVRAEPIERDLKMHFRGRVWGRVRPEMVKHLQPAPDTLITSDSRFRLGTEGTQPRAADVLAYYRELRRAEFALCPAGWTPWSRRIYEALLVGSIPVLIPGDFVPPFADRLDWSRFSLSVPDPKIASLDALVRGLPRARVEAMLAEVDRVREHFVYHPKPVPGDAGSGVLSALRRVWERLRTES